MKPWGDFALLTAFGAAMAGVHLWLLWRGVRRLTPDRQSALGARLVLGLPLRVFVWAPCCIIAAQRGLFGCLGLVAGSLIMRWCIVICALHRGRLATAMD